MELADLISQIDGFDKLPPREKIRVFAWFLHVHKKMEHFTYDDIRGCYKKLHILPDNIAKYVTRMVDYNPPDVVRERNGFKLARIVRGQLDAKHGVHHSVVQVSKLLAELPGKIPDIAEKNFLTEAIKCYRVEAYRACVVMTWNLAYSHLLHWILGDAKRLDDFHKAVPRRYPKKPPITVAKYDDFDELKESEVVEICANAGLTNSNLTRILREKLGKRNMCAHPSTVTVVQSQADDVVTDLVNNVVLALT